jgi:hypothetical protein
MSGSSEGSFDTQMSVVRTVIVCLLVLVIILLLLNVYLFQDKGPWFLEALKNAPIFHLWN